MPLCLSNELMIGFNEMFHNDCSGLLFSPSNKIHEIILISINPVTEQNQILQPTTYM